LEESDDALVARVLAAKGGHYDVLRLKRGCSGAELKARYRRLAVRLHPDKCRAGGDGAKDAFQRVAAAYEALKGVVL
jgi:curved DNA-binding protein CbpA